MCLHYGAVQIYIYLHTYFSMAGSYYLNQMQQPVGDNCGIFTAAHRCKQVSK